MQQYEIFKDNLQNRGPDSINVQTFSCGDKSFVTAASVLWLQGQKVVTQPLQNEKSVFVYNGDVFGGNAVDLNNIKKDSDTIHFWRGLDVNDNITEFLTDVEGPYAFVYLNKKSKKLYFARDPYGRRSLLLGKSDNVIVLCSVAKRTADFNFIEVPAIGVFCYDLAERNLKLFSWQYKNSNFYTKIEEVQMFLHANIQVVNTLTEPNYRTYISPKDSELNLVSSLAKINDVTIFENLLKNDNWMKNVLHIKELLETAIEKRISSQPRHCSTCILEKIPCSHTLTGVLFSGGVDCSILALLADKYTEKNRPIDLINVAFDESQNYRTPDRLTGLQILDALKKLRPNRKWNFLQVNITKEELNKQRNDRIADLIYPLNSVLDDSLGCALWFASRGLVDDYKSPCRVSNF